MRRKTATPRPKTRTKAAKRLKRSGGVRGKVSERRKNTEVRSKEGFFEYTSPGGKNSKQAVILSYLRKGQTQRRGQKKRR